jgi:hypothetical protein
MKILRRTSGCLTCAAARVLVRHLPPLWFAISNSTKHTTQGGIRRSAYRLHGPRMAARRIRKGCGRSDVRIRSEFSYIYGPGLVCAERMVVIADHLDHHAAPPLPVSTSENAGAPLDGEQGLRALQPCSPASHPTSLACAPS